MAESRNGNSIRKIIFLQNKFHCSYYSQIEQNLSVASDAQKRKFNFGFFHNVYRDVFDEHLWLSVFCRPRSNHFTRVQRCTCCFVLLYTGMLLNILYYDQMRSAKNDKQQNGLSIGPFYVSREQVCHCTCSFPDVFVFQSGQYRNN